MKPFLIGLFLGALVGGGIACLLSPWESTNAVEVDNAALHRDIAHLQTALKAEQQKSEALRQAALVQKPAAVVMETEEPVPTPQPKTVAKQAEPAAKKSPFDNPMMKEGLRMHYQQKMETLNRRLKLTPFQQQQLQAATDRELGRTEKMMSGDFEPNDPKLPSFEETINSVLTPDQKQQYSAITAEERQGQLEMMTTMEMTQSSSGLGLTEDQKDKMYRALFQVQTELTDPKKIAEMGSKSGKSNVADFLDLQNQKKVDALSVILSAEQLGIYRKNLDRQAELQKQFLDKLPNGAR